MDDDVLSFYDWQPGDCFKCAHRNVPTTPVSRVTAQCGKTHIVRACQRCLREMEAQRKRAAERRGERYEPGQLGT
ncbi:hypothetical protein [Streptomyces smyrnaeus]|uniref:hypothetical protein n=1 Tax=Streptomyces smyrnaeus TaxID=1387713 RepID=UPI0033E8E42F